MRHEKNNSKYSKGMIGTLCVLFFAIVMEDYASQHFTWYWFIPLVVVAVGFILTSGRSEQKTAD